MITVIIVIMVIKTLVGAIFKTFEKIKNWAEIEEKIYESQGEEKEIYSLWDFLSFAENTQAYHLVNVIGFDEWVNMEEIRRRIKEIFSIEYKNEKSLYPYLKTLTDINLFESTNIGGRKKWRKKELFFELEIDKEEGKEKSKITIRASSKTKE